MNKEKIIYMDNKPHIKCGVIILPAKNKEKGLYLGETGTLYYSTNPNQMIKEYYTPQYLYITSDEEIKEGEWCFEVHNDSSLAPKSTPRFTDKDANTWWLRQMNMNCSANDPQAKKIIASTDILLNLYQPSKQFIEKYIEEYNKGNIITEVFVEVELINKKEYIDEQDAYGYDNFIYKLKLDSQNQITIRKQKDSWNREEHCKNLHEFAKFANNIFDSGRAISIADLNEWIEKNL